MNYSFANDELFLLCIINGSETVTGLADPFGMLSDEEAEQAVKETVSVLENRKVIYRENGKLKISSEYEKCVRAITEYSTSYILVNKTDSDEFVFVNSDKAVHMFREGEQKVVLEFLDTKTSLKEFFRKRYTGIIVPDDTLQYMISVSSEIIDKAIEQVKYGNMEKALEIMDSDELERDEMTAMLDAVVYPTSSETIIARDFGAEKNNETIMKICNTPACSRIIKISTTDKCRNTLIFKATADDITKMLFEF